LARNALDELDEAMVGIDPHLVEILPRGMVPHSRLVIPTRCVKLRIQGVN